MAIEKVRRNCRVLFVDTVVSHTIDRNLYVIDSPMKASYEVFGRLCRDLTICVTASIIGPLFKQREPIVEVTGRPSSSTF